MTEKILYARFAVPDAVLDAHRNLFGIPHDIPDIDVLHGELAKVVRSGHGDSSLLSKFKTLEPNVGQVTFSAYNSMIGHAIRQGHIEGREQGFQEGRSTISSKRWILSILVGVILGTGLSMGYIGIASATERPMSAVEQ